MHQIKDEQMDPEIRTVGRVARALIPYMKESTFHKANWFLRVMKGRGPKDLKYREVTIPRDPSSGAPGELRLCMYQPLEARTGAPGVLWIHGGGYCLGVPEMDVNFIRELIETSGCTVVAPDYCLAVERPYPAALLDCYTALKWMKENAGQLGIREDQLMVGGDSAGGGLTAALCIYARDKGEVSIVFQMPLYPMLDDRMLTPSSQNNDAPLWNTKSNEEGWRLYLGELYKTDEVPASAAPGRLENFSDLPPAYTFVGDIEPFHDETVSYMERLKQVGVPAEYDVYPGCYHAFDIVAPKSEAALTAHARLRERFAFAVEHYRRAQP